MIGRRTQTPQTQDDMATPQGFDAYDMSLGDLMRGERATLGKSLLDVQRELRIKASYIAAIENCDPSAFDTPGFIAGYVRSYARYLGMDPDEAFAQFCAESGFSTAHGMSEQASTIRRAEDAPPRPAARDPLADPRTPFAPRSASPLANVEPGAVGSSLVLLALIAGIGYGGWTVLREIQRVQMAPVDQTPLVLSELDPLQQAMAPSVAGEQAQARGDDSAGVFTPPTAQAFDRLYRPQALDVPVVVARDAPISTLDPDSVGVFAGAANPDLPRVREDRQLAAAALQAPGLQTGFTAPTLPGVDIAPGQEVAAASPLDAPGVTVLAVRPSWVRITDTGGTTLYSGILNAGDTVPVPAGAADPSIEVGEAGAIYFAMQGRTFGPAGPRGQVASDVPLDPMLLAAILAPADPEADADLGRVVAELNAPQPVQTAETGTLIAPRPGLPRPSPQVLAARNPGVTIVATREAWVRVKGASGATVYEALMQPGDTWTVPQTEEAPTIRTGDAGAIYFAVAGRTFGPYGGSGAVMDGLALAPGNVTQQFAEAEIAPNSVLERAVAEMTGQGVAVPRP